MFDQLNGLLLIGLIWNL